jgi:hypothetical protein
VDFTPLQREVHALKRGDAEKGFADAPCFHERVIETFSVCGGERIF